MERNKEVARLYRAACARVAYKDLFRPWFKENRGQRLGIVEAREKLDAFNSEHKGADLGMGDIFGQTAKAENGNLVFLEQDPQILKIVAQLTIDDCKVNLFDPMRTAEVKQVIKIRENLAHKVYNAVTEFLEEDK